jgi:hypothetical protein
VRERRLRPRSFNGARYQSGFRLLSLGRCSSAKDEEHVSVVGPIITRIEVGSKEQVEKLGLSGSVETRGRGVNQRESNWMLLVEYGGSYCSIASSILFYLWSSNS